MAGFEIESVESGGEYKMPPFEDYKLAMSVVKPGRDVEVNLTRRIGYQDVKWAFEV